MVEEHCRVATLEREIEKEREMEWEMEREYLGQQKMRSVCYL